MNKKNVILIGVVVCAVVATGIFYWNANREIKGSPDDYVVTEPLSEESEQGRFVENKKAGLKVRIPDNWTEEKMDVMQGSMVFYSPDMESMRENTTSLPLKKGCMIEVGIIYQKKNFEELKREIQENQQYFIMQSENQFETIEVDGTPALKNIFDCMDLGHSIDVYIMTEEILYAVGMSTATDDIEKCSQEFDRFLEGVVINN